MLHFFKHPVVCEAVFSVIHLCSPTPPYLPSSALMLLIFTLYLKTQEAIGMVKSALAPVMFISKLRITSKSNVLLTDSTCHLMHILC